MDCGFEGPGFNPRSRRILFETQFSVSDLHRVDKMCLLASHARKNIHVVTSSIKSPCLNESNVYYLKTNSLVEKERRLNIYLNKSYVMLSVKTFLMGGTNKYIICPWQTLRVRRGVLSGIMICIAHEHLHRQHFCRSLFSVNPKYYYRRVNTVDLGRRCVVFVDDVTYVNLVSAIISKYCNSKPCL